MDFDATARQAAASHEECDDPGCAFQHDDTSHPQPGDGAAEVTMTEVYDLDLPWGHHPSGW